MATYRAGIVGLTGIAAGPVPAAPHAVLGQIHGGSHAAAYAQIPAVTVVGACDLVPERRQAFLDQWRGAWPEVKAYGDYREMLAEGQLDLLSVVTSDHRHAQIVVDAAEAGVRGIYCEKPIATTLAEADRMIAACRDRGVVLSVDHTRRWRPLLHQVRSLIRSGELGHLRSIVATMAGPRAMLFRNGTHLLDLVCFLADAEPESLVAELDDEHRGYGPRYAGDGGRDPALDPGGSIYLRFQNGVRAFVNSSKTAVPAWDWVLNCERGRIRGDDASGAAEVTQLGVEGLGKGRPVRWLLPVAPTTRGSLEAGVEEIIAHLEARDRGETPAPLVSPPEDARRTLQILLGALQSNHADSKKISFPIQDI